MKIIITKTDEEWEKIRQLANGKSVNGFVMGQLRKKMSHVTPCDSVSPTPVFKKHPRTLRIPKNMESELMCLARQCNTSISDVISRIAIDPLLPLIAEEGSH